MENAQSSRKLVPVYVAIARALEQATNCRKSGNAEWLAKALARADKLVSLLPHGSGFESVKLSSVTRRGVFNGSSFALEIVYHHMDDAGYYDGRTTYTACASASLAHGVDVRVSCPSYDRGARARDAAEYIGDTLHDALLSECDEWCGEGE